MHRFLSLALLSTFLLASAPSADAQLRGLINRARDAVTGASETASEAASNTAGTVASRAQGSLSSSSTVTVDYARFLNTTFWSNQGIFNFGGTPRVIRGKDHIIFPPSGIERYDQIGHYLVRKDDGTEVARQTIVHDGMATSDAFVVLLASSGADWSEPIQGGNRYTMDIEIGGEIVGTFPFSAESQQSGDAFNPGTTTVLDGPWRTHAFFQHATDEENNNMAFYAWLSPDEIEDGKSTEISIRRGGREIAWGRGFADLAYGWGAVQYTLYKPEGRDDQFGRQVANAPLWDIEDVTPGEYEIQFSDESRTVFRTMTIEGGAGTFVPHARSSMDHQPRSTFLTPRRMIGRGSLFYPHAVYWIAP